MERILFIDDESFFARPYITELQKAYQVAFCESAIEAIEAVRDDDSYRAIVLDIQMPPPRGLPPGATNNGMETGLWLLGEVRDIIISRPLPVLILTVRMPQLVEEGVKRLVFPDQLIEIHQKASMPYTKLPIRLDIMLRRWPCNCR